LNAEIVGIGTELLLGQIANTNAQKISTVLAGIGIDVYFHVVVGDNHERIGERAHARRFAGAVGCGDPHRRARSDSG
jgi:nicotinamide-nucleotide amidase